MHSAAGWVHLAEAVEDRPMVVRHSPMCEAVATGSSSTTTYVAPRSDVIGLLTLPRLIARTAATVRSVARCVCPAQTIVGRGRGEQIFQLAAGTSGVMPAPSSDRGEA